MGRYKYAVIILLCLVVGSVAFYTQRSSTSTKVTGTDQNTSLFALGQIRGYKSWQQVTAVPEVMAPEVASQCATFINPTLLRAQLSPDNPHTEKYFQVYVNDIGKAAMLSWESPLFPVGSVIVKEKLSSRTSKTPELLTVMIKRQPGFHKAWDDWEYLVINGSATKVDASGWLPHCYKCHETRKEADYVFRSYRPGTNSSALSGFFEEHKANE